MRISHSFALTSLIAALILLPGCSTAPRSSQLPDTGSDVSADNEPDLVSQLRARMAAGPLQRQEKTEDKQTLEAAADTSQAPTVSIDPTLQMAAQAVQLEYNQALALMKAGKNNEALALFAKIAGKAPKLSGPLVNQALILGQQQKYAEAQALLEKALEVNPKNPFAYNQLGVVLRQQGKFAEATKAYQSALELDPNYAKALFNSGVLADMYLQDLPLALQYYQRYQALQNPPDQAVANWIVDLQKRTGTYVPPAKPALLPPLPEEDEDAESEDTTDTDAEIEEAP